MLPTVATFDAFSGKFLSAEKLASKPPLGGVEAAFNSVAPLSGATKAWEDAKLKGTLHTRYRTLPVLDRTAVRCGTQVISMNAIEDMFVAPVYVCEAPPRAHFVEYWHAILSKKISHVFILTNEVENDSITGTDRRLFEFFFPPNLKDRKMLGYDDPAARWELVCQNKTKTTDKVEWMIRVRHGGHVTEIAITQLRTWPAGGAPTHADATYAVLNQFRSARDPQLVMCDTGCGRSGSFVLAARMLDKLDRGLDIHPSQLLADLRKSRGYAVQNAIQFAYCLMILAHHSKTIGAATTKDGLSACAMLEEQFEKMRAAHTRLIGGGGAADGEDDSAREAEAGGGEEEENEGDANEEWVHAGYPHIPRPLGELTVEPDVLDFSLQHVYHIKITNAGDCRIGWAIKTTNEKRLGVDPPCGVLDPKEAVLMAVSCDAIKYGEEDPSNDRLTIEWTNTPDGAGKTFASRWFLTDGLFQRKNLYVKYV